MLSIFLFLFNTYTQDYYFNSYCDLGFVNLKLSSENNNLDRPLLKIEIFDKLSNSILLNCSSETSIELDGFINNELEIKELFNTLSFDCFDKDIIKIGVIENLELKLLDSYFDENRTNYKINFFPGFELEKI